MFPGGNEGRYEFDAPDAFIDTAPARVVDRFLSTVNGFDLPAPMVDFEVNAANRHTNANTVTATGLIRMRNGEAMPYVGMIYRNQNGTAAQK